MTVTLEDFHKLDIRVGKIISAELIPDATYSTHKLLVDFGKELGIKKSCARLVRYRLEELTGRLVLCVTNLPPRQIGKNMSEVYTLGVPFDEKECALIGPSESVALGGKVY